MRNGNRLTAILLALVMMLSLAPTAAAGDGGERYEAVVRFENGVDAEAKSEELSRLPGVRVTDVYEALFPGAAVEADSAALKLIDAQTGVVSVALSRTWAAPCAVGDPAGTSNSLDVMRGEDIPYDGSGRVIAVIDSGLYLSHETFADWGLITDPALTEEDIEAFAATGGTDGRYVSAKIPFAYDYSADDRSVHTADAHGTHVSALAAGYALHADGTVKFSGVAPAAQLLAMKVFPDNAELGARDSDILRAMEDAFLLGADIVNLSLGTEDAFMEDDGIGEVYREIILKLRRSGIIVCCAAGNYAGAVSDKTEGIPLPTADYTDYGTPCTPAAYPGATAVAAVNAATRGGGGGIVVGDVLIGYTEAVNDTAGESVPPVDALFGKTLPYVVIDGLGEEKDFAGLDLTGCVALVQRGVIYFSEKTNNAAAAGAVACVIYNNEAGAILPSVEGTTIPCVMISREAGAYLVEHAENGRGRLTVEPDDVMVSTGDRLTMQEHSSWGVTPDLRLFPTLTAPGGTVYSAVTGGKDRYGYISGTSMAAPNAAGAFAVMMQALEEAGVESRTERASLAEDTLACTAAVLTEEDGVFLSPRRQGAGVIDLAAALESDAVIRDPVITMGESGTGAFSFSLTIENRGSEEKTFAIDTTVLTDGAAEAEGVWYTTLASVDITDAAEITAAKRVTVAAGGRRSVAVTVRIPDGLREDLFEIFENGFFVEGFVCLTDSDGEAIHAAYMGYCGDWEAAPVMEQADFRDLMNAAALSGDEVTGAGVNMWYNIPFAVGEGDRQLVLGENPWLLAEAWDERIAISSWDSDAMAVAGRAFSAELYTLRNAARIVVVISDRRTGEIYYVSDSENVPRSDIGDVTGVALPALIMGWDGKDARREPLPGGTSAAVEVYAWTESDTAMQDAYRGSGCTETRPETYRFLISGRYDDRMEWQFPLVLDGEAPRITGMTLSETGETILTLEDDRFLSRILVEDGEGNELLRAAYDETEAGKPHTLTIPGTAEKIYAVAVDYAGNAVGWEVDTAAGSAGIRRCCAALFTDVRKNAWYHAAVDHVCENGLMDATGEMRFEPDRTAMRATVIEALYRLAGAPGIDAAEMPFVDAKENEWYYDALCWAWEMGIAEGYTEDSFVPLAPVPRQQLAVMLHRAAKLSDEVTAHSEQLLSAFADREDVADWAAEAVAWAVGEGILAGDSKGRLNPKTSATRAELAQIMMNIMENN